MVAALVSRKIQRGEVPRAKRVHVLSENQIREIVRNSDDEKKHYASTDTEDEEPRPISRWSSLSEPPSQDFSASSCDD